MTGERAFCSSLKRKPPTGLNDGGFCCNPRDVDSLNETGKETRAGPFTASASHICKRRNALKFSGIFGLGTDQYMYLSVMPS